MATAEGETKKKIKELFAKLKSEGTGIDIKYDMYVPTGRGKRGRGDFVCCVNGLYLEVEAKSSTNKMTTLQKFNQTLVRKSGGFHMAVYGKDGVGRLETFIRYLHRLSVDMQCKRAQGDEQPNW